jgi:hypothetical protein
MLGILKKETKREHKRNGLTGKRFRGRFIDN